MEIHQDLKGPLIYLLIPPYLSSEIFHLRITEFHLQLRKRYGSLKFNLKLLFLAKSDVNTVYSVCS